MLRKTVSNSQRDWHEKIPETLWSYRTSTRMSTGATPFLLMYGTEAVLPIEIELPSLRLSAAANLSTNDDKYIKNRIASLDVLQEEREETQKKLKKYHDRATWMYNQHVRTRKFKIGTLVLCNKVNPSNTFPIHFACILIVSPIVRNLAPILYSMQASQS